MLSSNYIKALEVRARWLHWISTDEAKRFLFAAAKTPEDYEIERNNLLMMHGVLNRSDSDTFFMVHKFVDLVEHAKDAVPKDLQFDFPLLQSLQGWLFFERPIIFPNRVPELKENLDTFPGGVPCYALGWFLVPVGSKTFGGELTIREGVQFVYFQSGGDLGGCTTLETNYIVAGCTLGEALQTSRYDKHGIVFDTVDTFSTRLLFTILHLMSQRLSITVRHDTDRHTRRRGEFNKCPVASFIRVVTLRRLEEDRKKRRCCWSS